MGGSFGTTYPLLSSPSDDGLVYTEFARGTASFTSGAVSCGPFTLPAGYYSATRCKFSPLISAVGPLLQNVSGVVVQSGSTITISGVGFGQTRCSTCQVTLYESSPPALPLTVSSWSDTAITAPLPSYGGFAVILVQTASGEDYINIMTAPLVTTSPVTIQTIPAGLQFSVDGAAPLIAPQTLSLTNNVAHTALPPLSRGQRGRNTCSLYGATAARLRTQST
jgi:hypothetical protein